ncbi:tyrosine--tRNA ligase [Patescibacteria group bacterium]|nr:tyrosine--tRNA ligase [Patescibacteria group bacterium]
MKTHTGTVVAIAGDLKARGFIQDEGGGTAEEFLAEKRSIYWGVDPTADSIHLGNLVPILLMRRLADAGHEVRFLVGGGTGMIGDPRESGERVLLDAKTVAKNTKAIQKQLSKILGKNKYTIIDNALWLNKLSLVEFLRDTAKHFTVNQLIKRDIIKKRLDDENDSISFTEFSYSLLQGYDFWYLNNHYGVDMQVGGSDQWGNILSGVELIRRREAKSAYALTTPIIMDTKTGKKFGKSEGNAVWLDPEKTSPFDFYQFWLNVADEGLREYFNIFTFLDSESITEILSVHTANPGIRSGQKRLAREVTELIHGASVTDAVAHASEILYGEDPIAALGAISEAELTQVRKYVHGIQLTKKEVVAGMQIADALLVSGLVSSKGEGRRLIEGKGVSLNAIRVEDPAASLNIDSFVKEVVVLKAGKKVALLALK